MTWHMTRFMMQTFTVVPWMITTSYSSRRRTRTQLETDSVRENCLANIRVAWVTKGFKQSVASCGMGGVL